MTTSLAAWSSTHRRFALANVSNWDYVMGQAQSDNAPKAPFRILLLEREAAITRLFSLLLEGEGLVAIEGSDTEPDTLLSAHKPDLVFLSITPHTSGMVTLGRLKETSSTPVIALTTVLGEGVPRAALENGADDLVTMPFDPDNLIARVRCLLGLPVSHSSPLPVITTGNLEIDLSRRTLTIQGSTKILSWTEWQMLQALAANAGRPLFHKELAARALGTQFLDDTGYLKAWLSRLQVSLGDDPEQPSLIQPFHEVGYRLVL